METLISAVATLGEMGCFLSLITDAAGLGLLYVLTGPGREFYPGLTAHDRT